METCYELFGREDQMWYNVREFKRCADHVVMQWSESRHNINYSRFDAVNNKYDNLVPP